MGTPWPGLMIWAPGLMQLRQSGGILAFCQVACRKQLVLSKQSSPSQTKVQDKRFLMCQCATMRLQPMTELEKSEQEKVALAHCSSMTR